MTPQETNIVKSLIAVAWADGKLQAPEAGVIEGLLCGFEASDEEEAQLLEYALKPRTLEGDIPLAELSEEDRELLLANAALLTLADGQQSDDEKNVLDQLIEILGFDAKRAADLVESARDGVLNLSSRALDSDE